MSLFFDYIEQQHFDIYKQIFKLCFFFFDLTTDIIDNDRKSILSRLDSRQIYNEKLLKLAFNISELTFLQAKQQVVEDCLQNARQRNESHAVIEVNIYT